MTTPDAVLAAELRRDPTRPLLTAYDDTTGERVELSVATVANWSAKVAGYCEDELALAPGDVVGLDLPAGWQGAVALLGCWAAGAEVVWPGEARVAEAVAAFVGPTAVTRASWGCELVTVELDAMGLGLSRLVANQPDRHTASAPGGGAAIEAARGLGLTAGVRLLTTYGVDTAGGVGYGLLGPLVAGGSVVVVRNPDPARLAERAASEQADATAGLDVAGLPRLDGS